MISPLNRLWSHLLFFQWVSPVYGGNAWVHGLDLPEL
jgi:hypothetical protein